MNRRGDRATAVGLLLALVLAGRVWAGGELFDGCVDAGGRNIATTIDYGLKQVALAASEDGKAVLRCNPQKLPSLSSRARLFFFAHECARLALGHPLAAQRTLQRARQADCWAAATLQRSGEMDAAQALRDLRAELVVGKDDWAALPGPARAIDLAACSRPPGALRLPDSAPPSEAQARANHCVQICGDRSWQCQNRCRDETCRAQCLTGYGSCEAACGTP